MSKKIEVTKEEFDSAMNAVWSEIKYQDNFNLRTDDEADSIPAFLTLLRRYTRKAEDAWADNPGELQLDGKIQVTEALHSLRKLAAIAVRSMVYNGVRER
jgi:hypothetical protein